MHWRSNLPASQLFICNCVILNMEGLFTFLPPRVVGQQLASDNLTRLWQLTRGTWELLELEDWKPNKLRTSFLHKWSKGNLVSSTVVTFLDGPYGWNCMPNNSKFSNCSTHTTAQIIKISVYGVWVVHYDIQPKNLNNMEHEFHLLICKGWSLLYIWTLWFFGVQNIELQIWVDNIQYTTSHQHK